MQENDESQVVKIGGGLIMFLPIFGGSKRFPKRIGWQKPTGSIR